jgi:hypothetical protein
MVVGKEYRGKKDDWDQHEKVYLGYIAYQSDVVYDANDIALWTMPKRPIGRVPALGIAALSTCAMYVEQQAIARIRGNLHESQGLAERDIYRVIPFVLPARVSCACPEERIVVISSFIDYGRGGEEGVNCGRIGRLRRPYLGTWTLINTVPQNLLPAFIGLVSIAILFTRRR